MLLSPRFLARHGTMDTSPSLATQSLHQSTTFSTSTNFPVHCHRHAIVTFQRVHLFPFPPTVHRSCSSLADKNPLPLTAHSAHSTCTPRAVPVARKYSQSYIQSTSTTFSCLHSRQQRSLLAAHYSPPVSSSSSSSSSATLSIHPRVPLQFCQVLRCPLFCSPLAPLPNRELQTAPYRTTLNVQVDVVANTVIMIFILPSFANLHASNPSGALLYPRVLKLPSSCRRLNGVHRNVAVLSFVRLNPPITALIHPNLCQSLTF